MSATLKMLPEALAESKTGPPRHGPKDLVVPTRMKDRAMIEAALDAAGIKRRFLDDVLWAETVDEQLFFAFIRQGAVFEGHFAHDTALPKAEEMVQVVTHEYQRLVQQRVYERVIAQSETQGMVFKSEVVTEDNAIVVTLEVTE
jgi:hypothetical protein